MEELDLAKALDELLKATDPPEGAALTRPSQGIEAIEPNGRAPPPLHDEAVSIREYDEDDYSIRRYAAVWRLIISGAVIIAVPVMVWTITIFIRSYVERPKTHLTEPLLTASLPPKSQAAQRAPAPFLTETAGGGLASLPDPPAETVPNAPAVASGEAAAVTDSAQSAVMAETAPSETVAPEAIRGGLASLPDPNSGSLKGPLAPPPGDAPSAASPTGPAETVPNAPAAASREAAAVTDSAQSAVMAETASSETVTPEPIRGRIPLRDRMAAAPTATGPVTGSMVPVGPAYRCRGCARWIMRDPSSRRLVQGAGYFLALIFPSDRPSKPRNSSQQLFCNPAAKSQTACSVPTSPR